MDFDLCVQTLKKLKEGRNVEIPVYDFSSHSRYIYIYMIWYVGLCFVNMHRFCKWSFLIYLYKFGLSLDLFALFSLTINNRLEETQRMYGANVIIFEGIMTFHSPELRDLMDMKIFVDTDSDIRLARRCMCFSVLCTSFIAAVLY